MRHLRSSEPGTTLDRVVPFTLGVMVPLEGLILLESSVRLSARAARPRSRDLAHTSLSGSDSSGSRG